MKQEGSSIPRKNKIITNTFDARTGDIPARTITLGEYRTRSGMPKINPDGISPSDEDILNGTHLDPEQAMGDEDGLQERHKQRAIFAAQKRGLEAAKTALRISGVTNNNLIDKGFKGGPIDLSDSPG